MTGQKLVDELEKPLTDEAYDGGMGAMSPEEFRELVRTLAVTAADVFEKAHTPTDDEQEALVAEALRPMTDLDVIQDPGVTRAFIRRLGDALDATLRRSERPEQGTARLDYYDPARQDRISEHDCVFEDGEWWFGHGMPCKHPKLHAEPQGEPSDAHLRGRWSNGDPVHIITDGIDRRVAPNSNGATWIPEEES